jgi:hypothetical protein
MKVVAWAETILKDKILEEYADDDVVVVDTLELFKRAVSEDALLIIGMSFFTEFDTTGFTESVANFVHSNPELTFHMFLTPSDNAAWEMGGLLREPNTVEHAILHTTGNDWSVIDHIKLD